MSETLPLKSLWSAAWISQMAFAFLGILATLNKESELLGLLVLVAFAVTAVTWGMLHFRCWKAIYPQFASIPPERAVGFMFIPGYNFYWAFVSFIGLAKGFNARAGSAPALIRDGTELGRALAIAFVASFVVGWIPVLDVLTCLAYLVVFILYYQTMVGNAAAVAGIPLAPTLEISRPAGSYPKWPWIGTVVNALLWLLCNLWAGSVEHQARPWVNEYGRMNSDEYVAMTVLESFVRGAQGDAFGKAREEYAKSAQVEDQIGFFKSELDSAEATGAFFLILTLAFAGLWIWQHLEYRKRIHPQKLA